VDGWKRTGRGQYLPARTSNRAAVTLRRTHDAKQEYRTVQAEGEILTGSSFQEALDQVEVNVAETRHNKNAVQKGGFFTVWDPYFVAKSGGVRLRACNLERL